MFTRHARACARITGGFVLALGAIVLLGWALDIASLKSVFPGLVTMKANTALGLAACGMALIFLSRVKIENPLRVFLAAMALLIVALGSCTLGEYFFGWNLGIDQLLFRDAVPSVGTSQPGRMSPSTAFCFTLVGFSVGISLLQFQWRPRLPIIAALGATLVVLGGVATLGQITDILCGFILWNYFGMAVHTALGFVLLGGGLLAVARCEGTMKWALDGTNTAGFIVSIAIMLTVAGMSWNQTRQLQEAAMWVTHTHQVLRQIENVRAGMASLESSQRGYLILGDEHLLNSRQDAKEYVRNSISNLRTLTADNPHQKPRLDQLDPLVQQRTEFGERTIIVRRENGFPAAQQLLGTGIGIGLTNKIDQVLGELREEEESLLVIRQKKADAVSTATFLLLPVGVFLSLTILSLALFFLNAGFTERGQAEAALRESQGRFRSVMENLTEGLVIADLEGNPLYWNPSILKMFDFATAEEANRRFRELATLFSLSMVDGSPLPPAQWPFARLLRGEVLRDLELRVKRLDMDWKRIFSYNGAVVHNVGDKSLAFLTITDITERKMAEDASAQLAAIIDSSNDAIIGKDLHSIVTSWNYGAEKMFGYTSEEMIGCSIKRLIPADRQQEEESIIRRVKNGESFAHFDTLRLAKDGHSIDISVTVSPIKDKTGKIVGASKVAKDITERRRAQEALRESEKQFRTMVNAIPQLAWIAHADGFIYWYNQRWFDYTGTKPEEMEGWGWQCVHDPDYLPKVMAEWKQSIASGEPFEMEFPLRASDGHYGWFLTRVHPLKDESGSVVRWFGTNTDLSQKREDDEVIRKLNANLEQRVVERTAEFEAANKALEAANKELEAFSYSVSHDLRSPLRAVDGISQAVIEDYGSLLPEEGRSELQAIREEAQRMGVLIDDLLSFSRLSRMPLRVEEIKTDSQVRKALEGLKSQQTGRAVEINVGQLPSYHGCTAMLDQVWINLLSNALKYSRHREKAVIDIGCNSQEAEPVYFVRDNGAGFDMRYAHKLFGVFQRLHRSDEFEGTGVGLAIVQRIVHRHGGRIWVESAVNKGTTFYFTLGKPTSYGHDNDC